MNKCAVVLYCVLLGVLWTFSFADGTPVSGNDASSSNSVQVNLLAPPGVKIKKSQWALASVSISLLDSKGNLADVAGRRVVIRVDGHGDAKVPMVLNEGPLVTSRCENPVLILPMDPSLGDVLEVRVYPVHTLPSMKMPSFPFSGSIRIPIGGDHFASGMKRLQRPIKLQLHRDIVKTIHFCLMSGVTGKPIAARRLQLTQTHRGTSDAVEKATTDDKGRFSLKVRIGEEYALLDADTDHQDALLQYKLNLKQNEKVPDPWVIKTRKLQALVKLYLKDGRSTKLMRKVNSPVDIIGVRDTPAPATKGMSPGPAPKFIQRMRRHWFSYPKFHAGSLYLYGLPPGKYHFDISSIPAYNRYVITGKSQFRITKGQKFHVIKLTMRPRQEGNITLTVTNSSTKQPIPHAFVMFRKKSITLAMGASNSSGEVSVKSVAEGKYRLRVTASHYAPWKKLVSVPKDIPKVISLLPYRSLSVRVKKPSRTKKPVSVVVLQDTRGGLAGETLPKKVSNGKAVVQRLVDGPAIVLLFEGRTIVGAKRTSIRKHASCTIGLWNVVKTNIRVKGHNPKAHVSVLLINRQTHLPGGKLLTFANSDEHSMLVHPGDYEAYCEYVNDGQQLLCDAGEVHVGANAIKTVDLSLPSANVLKGVDESDLLVDKTR